MAGTVNDVVRLNAFTPVVGTAVVAKVSAVAPMLAVVIVGVKPIMVMPTTPPTLAEVMLSATVGAPSIVKVAFALSVGTVRVSDTM